MRTAALRTVTHHAFRFVLVQMAIEIGLLTEAAIAHGTAKRFLLVVDVADVTLQIARDAKGALAIFALIRLLARMCSQVTREIR